MNKKGQISFILYIFIVVIIGGVMLYVFSPTINDLRKDTLNEYNTDFPNGKPLEKLVLYVLMPLLWIGWILLSGVLLAVAVRSSEGIL
jgi:flagellar basal body-associated protein FliL